MSSFYLSCSITGLTALSQCSGETSDGKDFEAYIGAEKAQELKQLFTNWVCEIYRTHSSTIHLCRYLSVRNGLAMPDWARFSLSALESTPTTATGDGAADDQAYIDTASPSPDSSDQLNASSTQSDTTPNQPDTVQPSTTLNHPDVAPNLPDASPTQPSHAYNQLSTPADQPDTSVGVPQPDISHPPITATLSQVNPSLSSPIPDSTRPSPLQDGEPQPVVPSQLHSRTSVGLLSSLLTNEAISRPSAIPPSNILVGITNEPAWMKKRRTLDYFRGVIKFGDLPNIIEHWYELEGLLGFPGVVSVPQRLVLHLPQSF